MDNGRCNSGCYQLPRCAIGGITMGDVTTDSGFAPRHRLLAMPWSPLPASPLRAVTYDAETDTVNEMCSTCGPFRRHPKMAELACWQFGLSRRPPSFQKGALTANEVWQRTRQRKFKKPGRHHRSRRPTLRAMWTTRGQATAILGKAPEVVFCPNYYQEVGGQDLAQAGEHRSGSSFLGCGLEGYATADQLKDANYARGFQPRLWGCLLQG